VKLLPTLAVLTRCSPFKSKEKKTGSTMVSSSRQKKKNQERQSNFQGVLESWFAGDEEGINAYIHEMSRKQINIPKVLDLNWLKSEKLAETRSTLKHQKLKKLLGLTGNVYHDLVKLFYTTLILD